jgi:hypothetical protein
VSNAAEQFSAAKTDKQRRNIEKDLEQLVRKILDIDSGTA